MKVTHPLSIAAAGMALAAGAFFVAQNRATAVPVIDGFVLPPIVPGAEIVLIEGRVTDFNVAARTITALDTVLYVPPTLLIDTTFDFIGDITMDQWADPNLPSPIGGTVIANAVAGNDPITGMAVFTVTSIYWDLGENALVGPLVAADPSTGSFQVNGTIVKMNTDPRLPSKLLDINMNPTTIDQLPTQLGDVMDVLGYVREGIMYGTEVLSVVTPPNTGTTDQVIVERALWDPIRQSIEVRGWVLASPIDGSVAPTVTIDLGCIGKGTITVPTNFNAGPPIQGVFRWRSANNVYPFNPGTVCVDSPSGGHTQRPVIL